MTKENIKELLNTQTAGGVIISALKLWKPIQSVSVALIVIQLAIMLQLTNITFYTKFLFILGIIVFWVLQVLLIRLYFDKLLFEQIYEYQNIKEDIKIFDKIMNYFVCTKNKNRTMESRWLGTKYIITEIFILLILQVLIVLLNLIIN